MSLLMEPGQTFTSWDEFKTALDNHSKHYKVIFNIANAKTVEQSNQYMRRGPLFNPKLKYSHIILRCKHFGSYTSASTGHRPKQRSYKIDCRAFISVSACRKENYLIVRDSYHQHSHPCTEEIYNSYPEVRRLSKDEKRMVGTLLEMGVPVSQIKTAVGKNVTRKDLHNAKLHMKAVRLGLKPDENNVKVGRKGGELLLEKMKVELNELNVPIVEHGEAGPSTSHETDITTDVPASDISLTTEHTGDNEMNEAENLLSNLEEVPSDEVETEDLTGQTSNDDHLYTVVVAANETDKSNPTGCSTNAMAELQQLFDKHQNDTASSHPVQKIAAKSDNFDKNKLLEHIQQQVAEGMVADTHEKSCETCSNYMSPLDGHSECLNCLGPQHLHEYQCEHCLAMKQEQLNIRKKLLIKMRMKSLQEANSKSLKTPNVSVSDTSTSTSTVRKSNRVRKPRNFGDDMAVEDVFYKQISPPNSNRSKQSKMTKCLLNDGFKEYMVEFPKTEVDDGEYGDCLPFSKTTNSERFDHLLHQTSVFDDVVLKETADDGVEYEPDEETTGEVSKIMGQNTCPAIPTGLVGKYALERQFELSHCSVPTPVNIPGDPVVNSMSSSLRKLVQNAAVQTRLAIYDKLFTRLGVGMADEALGIISDLYSKVTNVTEISQDDLTTNLQNALDTVQALKDVLEELGVMSKDSLTTACHQRNISLSSLNKAKSTLKRPASQNNSSSASASKKSKFQPFTKPRLTHQVVSPSISTELAPPGEASGSDVVVGGDSVLKREILVEGDNTETSGDDETHAQQQHIVMEVALPSEISPSVLAPLMNVSPMSISTELLERLQNQQKDGDGVIQISMVK